VAAMNKNNNTKTNNNQEANVMGSGISRVEIKDFLAFKGEFAADFCPGVNVLIGGNGTGKTTLLKAIYNNIQTIIYHRSIPNVPGKAIFNDGENTLQIDNGTVKSNKSDIANAVYIPEKDILEHAKGLLTFIDQKQTGFSQIYKDVLVKAQDVPTKKQTKTQQKVGKMITDVIDGNIQWDKGEGSYYTMKTDGSRIPFANEASGFKKFGFLGLMVSSGQLDKGSVLFWDEPENSLNPKLIPTLVDILLELQMGGVQIFIATHSYDVARWFELNKKAENSLRYFNLSKTDNGIVADVANDYVSLTNSVIEDAGDKLLRRVAEVAAEKAGVTLK
jgi:AAA15 family ATPase/GTPase